MDHPPGPPPPMEDAERDAPRAVGTPIEEQHDTVFRAGVLRSQRIISMLAHNEEIEVGKLALLDGPGVFLDSDVGVFGGDVVRDHFCGVVAATVGGGFRGGRGVVDVEAEFGWEGGVLIEV